MARYPSGPLCLVGDRDRRLAEFGGIAGSLAIVTFLNGEYFTLVINRTI